MKKTIFGILVAILGGIIGAGAMFYYGLGKAPGGAPSAGAPPSAATVASGGASAGGAATGRPADGAKPADGVRAAGGGAGGGSGGGVGAGGSAGAGAAGGAGAQAGGGGGASTPPGGGAGAGGGARGPGGPGGPTAVEIAKSETVALPKSVTAVGTLRSDESVTLRSEVAGRIVALNFREGQPIAKGQKLAALDDSVPLAELEQAKANQRLAKAKYERAVELKGKGFISGQAQDEAENALRVADANVKLGEARLARLTILAPFSGTAGLRTAGVGDYLRDGQDIVNLEKTDPIKVDFKVPELFLSSVKQGQKLSMALDAFPKKEFTGTVFAINPQLDAAGRAVILRAQLPNRDLALRPGMFARVRLLLSENADAVVVPEQALVPQGEEQFVFKVVEGKAVRTKVDIGTRRDGRVEIVSGLGVGEPIVVAGWQRLRDGAAVRPAGGGGPGGGAGGGPRGGGKPGEGKSASEGRPAGGEGKTSAEGKPQQGDGRPNGEGRPQGEGKPGGRPDGAPSEKPDGKPDGAGKAPA